MPITCDRLIIEPGNTVSIRADWDEFNALLEELGDRRETRVAYRDGTLDLTVMSRKHRHSEEVVVDFIHSLFSELEMAFSVCSATLFKDIDQKIGVEPEKGFYIRQPGAVSEERMVDATLTPVPDLVIEAENFPKSYCENYADLGIAELWRYGEDWVEIQSLDVATKTYKRQWKSDYFPGLLLSEVLPDYLERVDADGYNTTLRAFREWVRKQVTAAAT